MSILIFSPIIFFPILSGNKYQGINSGIMGVDEWFYMTKGKEILDNHKLGNIYLNEGKDWYNVNHSYVEYLILAPIKILHLTDKITIATIYQIYGFLGVFAVILLIYFFIFQIYNDKLLGNLASLLIIGGYNFITNYQLQFGTSNADFNIYLRPILPISSLIGLFIFLNFLIKSLKSNDWKYIIGAGISFGALFYIYFFSWTYAIVFLGTVAFIYLLMKNYQQFKKIISVGSIGLLLGLYILIEMFLISKSSMGQQILFFWNYTHGRFFTFSKIAFLTLVIFLIISKITKAWSRQKYWPIFLSFTLTSWIVLNQQLVTGGALEQFHYLLYFIAPMSVLTIATIAWQPIKNYKLKLILFVLLSIAIYFNVAVHQYRATIGTLPMKNYIQQYRPVINFFNNIKTPVAILGLNRPYEPLFTVYTSSDLLWNGFATIFNTSYNRIIDSFCIYSALNKNKKNDFIDSFAKDVINYENYKYKFSGKKITLDNLNKQCSDLTNDGDGIIATLKRNAVNYIVWDKNISTDTDLSPIAFYIDRILISNNIEVYKLK